MFCSVIDDFFINFIGDDVEVGLRGNFRKLFNFFLRVNGPCRVGRGAERSAFVFFVMARFNCAGVILKSFSSEVVTITGTASTSFTISGYVTQYRCGDDHFVPFVADRPHGIIDGMFGAV